MKHLITLCAATLIGTSTALAAPLCNEFANAETMPKKYRKLAPVLSAGPSDWIITADQMDTEYVPGKEARNLLAQIVAEFEKRGTKLAIMMAPPRPLVAGQTTLNTLSDKALEYDATAVAASFNEMIEVLREVGVIAPNLLEVATNNETLRDAYYYHHDTHWTPRGAAESAVALADMVVAADLPAFGGVDVIRPEPNGPEEFSERGSLADMAKAVCGVAIAPVEQQIPVFPRAEVGLLDDTTGRPQILLAGSSFSNRYKKDAYRVADAISGALQADVVNYSVSGGGAIGAIEGILNAGLLEPDTQVDLVVWELPYTEGLRSVGVLRQLLGALQFDRAGTESRIVELETTGKTVIPFDGGVPDTLALNLPGSTLQRIKIDLRFGDGSKQTLGLVRKKHVPVALRSDWWVVSLKDLATQSAESATIRYDAKALGGAARVALY